MTELHQALAARVAEWREAGYRHDRFPAIAEVLGHAFEDDDRHQLRYLRAEEAREVANLRLQAIASLPHLGSAARSVRGTRRPLASLL